MNNDRIKSFLDRYALTDEEYNILRDFLSEGNPHSYTIAEYVITELAKQKFEKSLEELVRMSKTFEIRSYANSDTHVSKHRKSEAQRKKEAAKRHKRNKNKKTHRK